MFVLGRQCRATWWTSRAWFSSSTDRGAEHFFDRQHQSFAELFAAASEEGQEDSVGRQLAQQLAGRGFHTPSTIQALSFPSLLRRQHTVICAETGSGKTLAYLLPLLFNHLKQSATVVDPSPWPSTIVLVPNANLSIQIQQVIESIASSPSPSSSLSSSTSSLSSPSSSSSASSSFSIHPLSSHGKDLAERFYGRPKADIERVDILITDPISLRRAVSKKDAWNKRVPLIRAGGWVHPLIAEARTLVVDEADMLFSGHYGPTVQDILTAHRKASKGTEQQQQQQQVVFAGATFPQGPKSVATWIRKVYPGAQWAVSPHVHKSLASIEQRWIQVADDEARLAQLRQVVAEALARQEKVLVFANTIEQLLRYSEHLAEAGLSHLVVHGELPAEQRASTLRQFAARSDDGLVLLSTSLLSRGFDLPGRIHVVQADFAPSAIDHLHRIGRASRAGALGRATNLFDDASALLVQEIRNAESSDLLGTFSRGRSFARKMKRREARRLKQQGNLLTDDEDDDFEFEEGEEDDDEEGKEGERR